MKWHTIWKRMRRIGMSRRRCSNSNWNLDHKTVLLFYHYLQLLLLLYSRQWYPYPVSAFIVQTREEGKSSCSAWALSNQDIPSIARTVLRLKWTMDSERDNAAGEGTRCQLICPLSIELGIAESLQLIITYSRNAPLEPLFPSIGILFMYGCRVLQQLQTIWKCKIIWSIDLISLRNSLKAVDGGGQWVGKIRFHWNYCQRS